MERDRLSEGALAGLQVGRATFGCQGASAARAAMGKQHDLDRLSLGDEEGPRLRGGRFRPLCVIGPGFARFHGRKG